MDAQSAIKNVSCFVLVLFLSFIFLTNTVSADDLRRSIEWFEKGNELVASGNFTAAAEAFSKAIELNPQFVAAYYNRGVHMTSLAILSRRLRISTRQ